MKNVSYEDNTEGMHCSNQTTLTSDLMNQIGLTQKIHSPLK